MITLLVGTWIPQRQQLIIGGFLCLSVLVAFQIFESHNQLHCLLHVKSPVTLLPMSVAYCHHHHHYYYYYYYSSSSSSYYYYYYYY